MLPVVDLVITFRASPKVALSKQQIREDSVAAEKQYSRLLNTLSYAGLRAVARRGESLGHLLIFVNCPEDLLKNLVKREKYVVATNNVESPLTCMIDTLISSLDCLPPP